MELFEKRLSPRALCQRLTPWLFILRLGIVDALFAFYLHTLLFSITVVTCKMKIIYIIKVNV